MKLHRFFVGDHTLEGDFWLQDAEKFHQWSKVLRFEVGREVALFNMQGIEKVYQITEYGKNKDVHVRYVSDRKAVVPSRDVFLCFGLLKKDKNDWVLQKATELGVRHFVPLLTERTEKTGFDEERARKIVIEAAEQCGRVDIPTLREPQPLFEALRALENHATILVAEQAAEKECVLQDDTAYAIFIGPEGGWSDNEKDLFAAQSVEMIHVSSFTLRAETAAIAAASKVMS